MTSSLRHPKVIRLPPASLAVGQVRRVRVAEAVESHSELPVDCLVAPMCQTRAGESGSWLCHGNSIKHALRAKTGQGSRRGDGISALRSSFGSEDPQCGSRDEARSGARRHERVRCAILGRALPLVNNPIYIAEEFADAR
jgi:hypothetical protein